MTFDLEFTKIRSINNRKWKGGAIDRDTPGPGR